MKKYLLYTIISFISLFLINDSIFAQGKTDYSDKNRDVFWFHIGLRIYKDPELGERYKVIKYGSTVHSGTIKEYDEKLWAGLNSGSKIAIGPFNTYEDAKKGLRFYDTRKSEADTVIHNDNRTIYYYLVKPSKSKRLKNWQFERMPAAVTSGKTNNFLQLLKISLNQKKLVIGPFSSLLEAEESKKIFRLDE